MIHCYLAYVPRLFSFTTPQEKREIEKNLERYEAVKQRNERKEREEEMRRNEETAGCASGESGMDDNIVPLTDDTVVYPPGMVCSGTQTDLTSMDITALEEDYQQQVKECSEVCDRRTGYPEGEDLKSDEKLLHFYTGITSFTVLMAVFELVAAAIPETRPLSMATCGS